MPQPPLMPPDVAVSTSRAPLGGMARGRKAFAIGRSSESLWLGLLVAVIVALGAYGMMADLPSTRMGAEQKHIQLAVKYGSGDLNPHSFDHPPLLSYTLFVLYMTTYLVGLAGGWFHSLAGFERLYFLNPTLFYVIARVSILVIGAASVPLFYAIGKRLYGEESALMSTIWMAVAPVMIVWMHYATPTVPMFFMFLLGMYFSVRVLQGGGAVDSLLAGFLGGLAIATKYDSGLVIVPLLFAHGLAPQERRSVMFKRFAAAMMAMGLGFFVGCPFALLDLRAFVADWNTLLYKELMAPDTERVFLPMYLINKPGWLYVLLDAWPAGWGMPLTIVGSIGVVYALTQRRREDYFLLSLVVAAYVFIGNWQSIAPRYFIHVVPFALLLGARWMSMMLSKWLMPGSLRSMLPYLMTGLLIAVPAGNSVAFDRLVAQRSAHLQAKDWIERTISSGSTIAASASVVLRPNAHAIHRRLERIAARGLGQGVQLRRLLKYLPDLEPTYDVLDLTWPWRADYDKRDYAFTRRIAQGMQYVVVNQELDEYLKAPEAFRDQIVFFDQVKRQCALLKEFHSPLLWQESKTYTKAEYVEVYRCR